MCGMVCSSQIYACRMQVLLSSVVECWDKLRESSISVLMSLESPLPGIDTPAALKDLAMWAQRLVSSPRVRESDAGAQNYPDRCQLAPNIRCTDNCGS